MCRPAGGARQIIDPPSVFFFLPFLSTPGSIFRERGGSWRSFGIPCVFFSLTLLAPLFFSASFTHFPAVPTGLCSAHISLLADTDFAVLGECSFHRAHRCISPSVFRPRVACLGVAIFARQASERSAATAYLSYSQSVFFCFLFAVRSRTVRSRPLSCRPAALTLT